MAEIAIRDEHKPQLARAEHVLEWLVGERQRAEGEAVRAQIALQHIMAQGQREQANLQAFLQMHYGISGAAWTLDAERGVIVTPDAEPEAAKPESEPESEPAG